MSKNFSWLHLSDLHIGQQGQHLWPNFREQFHDDIRYLLQENGPIKLVIFSGDLTQTGSAAEFDRLSEELSRLWAVFAEFESRPYLFAVPGNHDLTRPSEKEAPVKLLKKWFEDDEIASELFSGKENQYLSVVTRCFENYSKWYAELQIPVMAAQSGILPGDSSCVIEENGFKVGLVGLNSAFMQVSGGDYEGKLLISPRQLFAVTDEDAPTWCKKNDFNLLVTHHPPEWLHPIARSNFDKEICKAGRFVGHLYGHMHEARSRTYSENGGKDNSVIQASSLFGLEHWGENGENKRIHGYSFNKIHLDEASPEWRIWPRVSMDAGKSDRIAPDHKFHLVRGKEYYVKVIDDLKESTAASSEMPLRKVDLSSEIESQKGAVALKNSLYRLLPSEHHLKIRITEQQNFIDTLSKNGIAWLSADWGVGRDGFIWSVLRRLGKEKLPIYRVELGNYDGRDAFLDAFANKLNCSFSDYCRSLAIAGPSILLFDEAPASIGEMAGKHIEEDVESLTQLARSYLPETLVIVVSRGLPRQSSISALKLGLLEEPDTRLYLQSQRASITEEINAHFVSQIQRKTEGLIANIDQLIRQLQVVNLADIDPPELSAGRNVAVLAGASISLVKTIAELESSKSQLLERAYLLLQILAILPNGESVQELKRIDATRPIFTDHALQLYERDLIDSKSVSVLIGQDGIQAPSNKLMVIPPQVREYVLSRMENGQISKLVRLAADMYFGKSWSSGKHKPAKITQIVSQESGGLSGNPHSLLLRMLGDDSLRTRPTFAASVLKVCIAYCTALLSADQYRRVVSVATEMLSLIPEVYERERNAIEIKLAKALRMSGEHSRSLPILEKLLKTNLLADDRISLLINKALCLQRMNNNDAIEVAKEIIKMEPKSGEALQASSIILEMQDEQTNDAKLLQIERQSRKGGHTTVANNLTLSRVKTHTDPSAVAALRTVYESAMTVGDVYSAHRAATKIARFTFLQNGEIESGDLKKLMAAYHYFYGERFGSLFTSSHQALWDYFESAKEIENQVALFRHSSFVWRLNGHEDHETSYLKVLEIKKSEILALGERIDKNVLYFLSRSDYQGNRLEDQSKKSDG